MGIFRIPLGIKMLRGMQIFRENIMKKGSIITVVIILLIAGYVIRLSRTDHTPPEVVETFPQNFSQDVSIDTKTIKFTFSKSMDPLRISYVIASGHLPEQKYRWENENKTLSISLSDNFVPGTTYALILNSSTGLNVNPGDGETTDDRGKMRDLHGNVLRRYPLVFVTRLPQNDQLRKKFEASELLDTDNDGLEDSLEIAIGTDINSLDTDGDGLSDYEEYCKYRTDATRADSDGDEKPDSDWSERREYTRTIRAICQLKPPLDIQAMNDLFQDAKSVNKDLFEVILYPDSTPRLLPAKYSPNREVSNELRKCLKPSFAINYSKEMQEQVRKMVSKSATERDVINRIQLEMGKMRIVPQVVNPLHLSYVGKKVVFADATNPVRREKINKSLMKYLKETYFADSMFKKKQFSSCASRATIRAGLLRAAGFPTRIGFAVPLLYTTEDKKEELIEVLKSDWLKEGVYIAPDFGFLIVNHVYNEVYLNNHWIRVDYAINEGILFANKYPYIKILSLSDWSEVDFSETWAMEVWFENRPYKTLSVSEDFPIHQSRYKNTDIGNF